jgi:hypothetical protein
MESLLTLPIGGYRTVELTLRLTMTLIVMTAFLQILCLSLVKRNYRLPLALSGIALLGAAWFESGVWCAWKEAFELAGTSYCVTGHLLAGEDRIIAWSLGLPVIFVCFGMLQLDPREKGFRNLCWTALGWAVLGPFFHFISLLGFARCLALFRRILTGSTENQKGLRAVTTIAVVSVALSFIVTELAYFHRLPLGKSAQEILVRGEIVHSLCDILALVVPGVALLIGSLGISGEHPQSAKRMA